MSFLDIQHIGKSYAHEKVIYDLSLSLEAHQTMSILGKSGCGKTTLLKIIAGLQAPDQGTILLNGQNVTRQSPAVRHIVYLYQEDLLFPHLNVFENIAFGLRLRKENKEQVRHKVTQMIDSLDLHTQAGKMPHQLSGGQKQRVSFGRALIINPALLLLDEPFSSLDAQTRGQMQQLFKKVAQEFSITSLFVTHDLKEAMLMGDDMALMQAGRLKVFQNKHEFITDPATGAREELKFWQQFMVASPNN